MGAERIRRVTPRPVHEPPDNEVPIVLAAEIAWHGTGVVFAIPALLLYSTGFVLLIVYRSRWPQVVTGDDLTRSDIARANMLHVRDIGEKLNGLKVNGWLVTQLGGDFNDHGYTGRAWVPAGVLVNGDQILSLDWPGIEQAEQRITRASIADAMGRVKVLW